MWRYALTATAEKHPLIGLGAGKPITTDLTLRDDIDSKSGVHNSFIGYAFYSGFPSAILVVLVFLWAGFGSWRHRAREHCAFLFGATLAAAVTCLTNVALETPYIAGPTWAALGAAVGAAAAASKAERMDRQD
jgi:O-antigen ligase